MATITVNQNEAPATAVTERKAAKPSSMRLSQETHAALEEAKRRLGAHSWDECFKSLLDGSASVNLYAADYPSRSKEVRQMGMLTSKIQELFESSWTLSSDTEARVTQEMKAIIAEKDNAIATLKEQLAGEANAREELKKRIEKLEVDLDMMRRERDAAQLRADTLAQANELSALIIYKDSPKSETSKRIINLPSFAFDVLQKQLEWQNRQKEKLGDRWDNPGNHVFTNEYGQPIHPDTLTRRFTKLAKRLGYPGVHLHTLRHSYASLLVSKGVPLKVISELLGHTEVRTTEIYAHPSREALKSAVKEFDMFGATIRKIQDA